MGSLRVAKSRYISFSEKTDCPMVSGSVIVAGPSWEDEPESFLKKPNQKIKPVTMMTEIKTMIKFR